MTLPEIFSLPPWNSFMGSALPLTMSSQSASERSSVQSAFSTVPAFTAPPPFFKSNTQAESGFFRRN